jgi:hypothetical protein
MLVLPHLKLQKLFYSLVKMGKTLNVYKNV